MATLIDQNLWVEPTITVLDGDVQTTFHIQDCFNFHGYDAVGGVVLGFRLMQAVQKHLNQDQPLKRHDVSLFTAFPGLGARDVFELITRMCSENRFELDIEFEHPKATKGVAGSFYYRFRYGGKTIELAPIEGAPSDDFINTGKASKDPNASAELLAHWVDVKHELANALLQSRADEVIRVL
ncbi:hypothetical protein [Orrella sp. 11846]|uniref:hypothetical protein n=1 Tax=Orrella sp. 11846 TaxID=3409913 RepID=UPI003B5A0C73